jgi:hypothetical protein
LGQPGVGGGIYSRSGSLTLTGGTQITNNTAVGFNNGNGTGGGIYVGGGTAVLTAVTVSSNRAVGGDCGTAGASGAPALGGGLYVECVATLTGVTLSANVATGGKGKDVGGDARGGALCVYGGSSATLTNLTLSSNTTQGGYGGSWGGDARGGALAVYCCALALTGSTFSSNQAVGGAPRSGGTGGGAYGGAVHFMGNQFNPSTLTLRDDRIAGNSAQGGPAGSRTGAAQGGGIYDDDTWNTAQLDLDASVQTTDNQPDDVYICPPLP